MYIFNNHMTYITKIEPVFGTITVFKRLFRSCYFSEYYYFISYTRQEYCFVYKNFFMLIYRHKSYKNTLRLRFIKRKDMFLPCLCTILSEISLCDEILSIYIHQYPDHRKYNCYSNGKGSKGQIYTALHLFYQLLQKDTSR